MARAMSLSIKVHLSAKLFASLRIFTRHVIHILRRTLIDDRRILAGGEIFDGGDELEALLRVGGGSSEERLPAGGGERVAEVRENEEEKEDDRAEE